MTDAAIWLVVISAFAHATWNLLLKRSTEPEITTCLMSLAASLLTLPLAIFLLIGSMPNLNGWLYIFGTIVLHILYFLFLGRAYKYGNLSVVYPVARGLGMLLIPVFGFLLLNELLTFWAAVGVAVILIGIICIGISSKTKNTGMVGFNPISAMKNTGILFAILTGITIGSYSILDKQGVVHVNPILYMFFLSLGGGTGMFLIICREYKMPEFVDGWKRHWPSIVIGGALQFTAYSMVLTAFQLSPVSYVGPFRELSIAIGVIMGSLILKEKISKLRAVGATGILAGAILIALVPRLTA